MRLSQSVRNAKPISECTNAELKQVAALARAHAERSGRGHLADDFASYLMLDLAVQGTLKYNLHWRWAQFLRDELGNLVNKKGRARSRANAKPVSIEEAIAVEAPVQKPDESSTVNAVAARLHGTRLATFVLRFKWDFTYDEIGEVLGVSRTRVMQILDTIEADLKSGRCMPMELRPKTAGRNCG